MTVQEWAIVAPLGFAYTPDEMAQIGRAVERFQAHLPSWANSTVRIDGLTVLPPTTTEREINATKANGRSALE